MTISLGSLVVDKVTGTIGTVTAYVRYLYGSDRVAVEYLDSKGDPAEMWDDVSRFELQDDE